MSNLRIVTKNWADLAVIAASSAAGALVAANMQTNIKTQVWRSVGTTATIGISWVTAKFVNCVIFPFTNLTNTATMRVRGYALLTDTVPVFDTLTQPCCPFSSPGAFGWDSNTPGVANFGHGGAVYAGLWFTGGSVQGVSVDIVDSANVQGYIEAARVVTGSYWRPDVNASYGAQLGYKDASSHVRNDAGDLLTDIKPRAKVLSLSFADSTAADRSNMMRLLRDNGLSTPVYISVFPGDADKDKEQDFQIFGKLTQLSALRLDGFSSYSSSIDIEEI